MAEQNILTRIQLKYDSYERWTDTTLGTGKGANFILKAGEMGICYLPSSTSTEQVEGSEPPQILFKVGDGKTKFSQLPWASAKAADVYAWAKAANKPTYSANEIGDLDGFFQLKQTDSEGYEYKLQSKDSKGNWVDVPNSTIKIPKPSAHPAYTIKKANSADTGYSATYQLYKDDVATGDKINIPKDMVVSSGSVEINPAGQAAGTYIVLTLANATNDKLYIPVNSLIEYVTSGSNPASDIVIIEVSNDHKVTATIREKSITKDKLAEGVQTSLGKADSAIQAVSTSTGLTATTDANKTVTIGIDTTVTFILDCGGAEDL